MRDQQRPGIAFLTDLVEMVSLHVKSSEKQLESFQRKTDARFEFYKDPLVSPGCGDYREVPVGLSKVAATVVQVREDNALDLGDDGCMREMEDSGVLSRMYGTWMWVGRGER